MSSLYTRSKEFTRNRKSQSDSPPASPSPTAKTLRVSLFICLVIAMSKVGNGFPWDLQAETEKRGISVKSVKDGNRN